MRTKYLCISLSVLVFACIGGCTSKSNNVASYAMQRGEEVNDKIINDLYTIATQQTLNNYGNLVGDAAAKSDVEGAKAALEGFATEYDKITWLAREQHSRAKEVRRISRRYILQQRGWFSILYEDWKNADDKVSTPEEEIINELSN